MRLDVFLKISRLIIRRSVAQEFCDAGKISVNGLIAKASKTIKAGDIIEIHRPSNILMIEVVQMPQSKQISKSETSKLYEIKSSNNIVEEF